MKSYGRVTERDDRAARPEEVVALRRMSESSDGGEPPSSFSDDDLEDDQNEGIDVSAHAAAMDGGRAAWKALLAAWLVDFMTSGECIYLRAKRSP
jgi:hypothetical protein